MLETGQKSFSYNLLSAIQQANAGNLAAESVPAPLLTAYQNYRRLLSQARLQDTLSTPQKNAIKQLLLQQKAYLESGLAMCSYLQHCTLAENSTPSPALLEFLLPIQQYCYQTYSHKANLLAQQTLQLLSISNDDINFPVHNESPILAISKIEITSWLQDYVLLRGNAGAFALHDPLHNTIRYSKGFIEDAIRGLLRVSCTQMESLLTQWQQKWSWKMGNQNSESFEIDLFLHHSTTLLDALVRLCSAWLWLERASAARRQLLGCRTLRPEDGAYCRGTIQTCLYFYNYELPYLKQQLDLLAQLDSTCLDMELAWL